jgi:hypothetical protein
VKLQLTYLVFILRVYTYCFEDARNESNIETWSSLLDLK